MLSWGPQEVERHRKFDIITPLFIINFVLHYNNTIFCRLLDILAGRKYKSGLTGQVLVNGQQQPSNFKCISGYVQQVN